MGINMLDVKQANARAILWELRALKTASIKDLSERTGLSFATVANVLSGFLETGEVLLGELLAGTGGRPSQTYLFNAEYAHILALSAQVRDDTHLIRACVGNLYGEAIAQKEQVFTNIDLASFEEIIVSALDDYPTIKVLAFAVPGVVRDGVILSNDYPALESLALPSHCQARFGLPAVVSNDVNAALMGYAAEAEPEPVIVGIYFPKHFHAGSAIMVDGQVLEGHSGWAGEVKLIPWEIDWVAVDYRNPQEIGPAIARLIGVFCAVVNPSKVVLYGDFFTEPVKQAIAGSIPTEALKKIFPPIVYGRNLDEDIIRGLFAQGLAAYKLQYKLKQ